MFKALSLIGFKFSIVVTTLLLSQMSWAEANKAEELSKLLGFESLIDSIPEQISPMVSLLAANKDSSQQQTIIRKLVFAFNATALKRGVVDHISSMDGQSISTAHFLLNDGLVTRVRNFEIAMQRPDIADKISTQQAIDEKRIKLIKQIDSLSATSKRVVLTHQILQHSVVSVAKLDHPGETSQVKQREYTEKKTQDWMSYAYRYMQNEELMEYIRILQSAAIQNVIENSTQQLSILLGRSINSAIKP